jgi:hypothetical protein
MASCPAKAASSGDANVRIRHGCAHHVIDRRQVLANPDLRTVDDRPVGGGRDNSGVTEVLAEQVELARTVDIDVGSLRVGCPHAGDVARQIDLRAFANRQRHLIGRPIAARSVSSGLRCGGWREGDCRAECNRGDRGAEARSADALTILHFSELPPERR